MKRKGPVREAGMRRARGQKAWDWKTWKAEEAIVTRIVTAKAKQSEAKPDLVLVMMPTEKRREECL